MTRSRRRSAPLEVGGEQLGLDQLGVGDRIDPALGMGDGAGAVGADHVADRVGLADRGEEPVAEPLALRGALDEARRCRGSRSSRGRPREEPSVVGDSLEPLVRDPDDGDVRLDRRERVVAGLGARPR